jgi:ADP-heptose:LPS heptosyltransferase
VTEAKRLFPEIPCIEHVDLACYAAILARAQLALCNDSGPMHLASAVNCPTIALFGATEPARFAPLNVRVLGQYGQWAALGDVQEAMQALFFCHVQRKAIDNAFEAGRMHDTPEG